MAFPLIPFLITGGSTITASITAYFTVKYNELNSKVDQMVSNQSARAVEYTKSMTQESLRSLVDPLKEWLRPIGKYAVRGYVLSTVLTLVSLGCFSVLGCLCYRELKRQAKLSEVYLEYVQKQIQHQEQEVRHLRHELVEALQLNGIKTKNFVGECRTADSKNDGAHAEAGGGEKSRAATK